MVKSAGAMAVLEDFRTLLAMGMATIREKLTTVPEDRFIARLVELWGFFFGTVLPYIQGIFEPLKPDAAALRDVPWLDAGTSPASLVRDTVLIAFRNEVVLPHVDRLKGPLEALFHDGSADLRAVDLALKITQMVVVLRGPHASTAEVARLDALLVAVQRPFRTLHLSLASLRDQAI